MEEENLNPELKANARRLMLENAPGLFIVSILFVAVFAVISELQFRLPGLVDAYSLYIGQVSGGTPHSARALFSYLIPSGSAYAVVLLFLGIVFKVGFMSYCLNTTRGLPADLRNIFDGFRLFLKTALIIVISAALITAWSVLLIIPGIAAYYAYRQAFYILLDDPGKGVLQCIRESKIMMRGHKVDLMLLDLSFILWFSLSALLSLLMFFSLAFSIPVISIWLTPYTGLSRAAFYDRLLDSLIY